MTNALENAMNGLIKGLNHDMDILSGHINWSIQIMWKSKKAIAGSQRMMHRCGYDREALVVINRSDIQWARFTYKKDWLELIKQLKENGISVKVVG